MPFTTNENINSEVCDKLANLSFGQFTKLYKNLSDSFTSDKTGKNEKV